VLIGNAIERFLGRTEEIGRVAKETLEGHLRGALATLTPEEVNEDRLKFANSLSKESLDDLRKLGLQLDTLKIQNVSDSVSYLDAIGRGAIANVIRDAEVAESDAQREAAQVEAESAGRASVKEANVDAAIVKMQNELRRIKADLESQVRSEEERTLAAAAEARAVAEQELQKVRVQLQAIQLEADKVLPADARKQQQQYRAQGDAAAIREQGRAVGEALDMLHEAWASAGDAALAISLIEQLEDLLQTAAEGVRKVRIDKLSMIDSGQGRVLSGYLSAYPAMIKSVFDAVGATTGIDIPRVIAGAGAEAKSGARRRPGTAGAPPRGGTGERKGGAS
jgi:flotillin